MRRFSVIFALSLLVTIVGFVEAAAQKRALWVGPRSGEWKLIASDVDNTNWTATLKLNRRGVSKGLTRYRGHFYWQSDDRETIGREYFTGSFDRKTGKLRLSAYAVKNIKGELGIGEYVASVNRKGRRLVRGSWAGNDTVPGSWSAAWSNSK